MAPGDEAYNRLLEKDPLSPPPSSRAFTRYEDRDSDESSDDTVDELDPLHSDSTQSSDDENGHPLQNGNTIPLRKLSKSNHFSTVDPLGPLKRARAGTDTLESQHPDAHRKAQQRPLSKLQQWLIPSRGRCVALLLLSFLILAVLGGGTWWSSPSLSIPLISTSETGTTIDGLSPPVYPSPRGGIAASWAESYRKAAEMVSRMTLIEKVNITTGTGWMMGMCVGNTGPASAAGFPALCLQDGPLGIRFADHITATPAGITVGSTWNKDLMYKRGKLLGVEARLKGVNVLLGPSVGPLGKHPAGGRNWEGFGADPVLQGVAAAQTIKGIQEEHVMATIKHFVGNEQEHFRQSYEWGTPNAISSNIDDRTLHEMYAWPFADAVKAGVASVMCSYNQVNNSYACQNSKLLNGILKDELGFQGFVQSDWLAQRSGVASALAGLDMSMPGDGRLWQDGKPYWGNQLTLAILNGSLPIARLDDMVTRIVASWYQVGQDSEENFPARSPNFSSWTNDETGFLHPGSDDYSRGTVNQFVRSDGEGGFSHVALARRIAAEGIVMVKNEGALLPLGRDGWPQSYPPDQKEGFTYRVAIFGEDAVLSDGGPNQCEDRACNSGTLASGWGSGSVEFPYLVSPYYALQNAFQDSVEVSLAPTNDLPSWSNGTNVRTQDLCIVFVNSDSGEGYTSWDDVNGDRNNLRLQKGGEELIDEVADNCGMDNPRLNAPGQETVPGDVIVVVHSVGPVILESFIGKANVRAVLMANLPGQESGNALKDIIFGDLNPSGHLPYTIAGIEEAYGPGAEILYQSDSPNPQQDFEEGLLIDYRYLQSQGYGPRFPFGYGLSYTNFAIPPDSFQISYRRDNPDRPPMFPPARPENAAEPPEYNSTIPDPSEALYPPRFRRLNKYIYPYISSTGDVTHGDSFTSPPATNESPVNTGGDEGGNPWLWEPMVYLDLDVLNIGPRDGQVVVQVYVSFPQFVYEEYEVPQLLGPSSNTERSDDAGAQDPVLAKRQQPQDDSLPPPVDVKPDIGVPDNMGAQAPPPNWPPIQDISDTVADLIGPPAPAAEPLPTAAIIGLADAQDSDLQPSPPENLPGQPQPPTDGGHAEVDAPPENADQPPMGDGVSPPPEKPEDDQPEDNPPPDLPPDPMPPPLLRPQFSGPTQRERIMFPKRVLRAFEKVHVPRQETVPAGGKFHEPEGETIVVGGVAHVKLELTRRDLSYWSTRYQNWLMPPPEAGAYEIIVGFHALDTQVKRTLWNYHNDESGPAGG